jgi:hypothetical protein
MHRRPHARTLHQQRRPPTCTTTSMPLSSDARDEPTESIDARSPTSAPRPTPRPCPRTRLAPSRRSCSARHRGEAFWLYPHRLLDYPTDLTRLEHLQLLGHRETQRRPQDISPCPLPRRPLSPAPRPIRPGLTCTRRVGQSRQHPLQRESSFIDICYPRLRIDVGFNPLRFTTYLVRRRLDRPLSEYKDDRPPASILAPSSDERDESIDARPPTPIPRPTLRICPADASLILDWPGTN